MLPPPNFFLDMGLDGKVIRDRIKFALLLKIAPLAHAFLSCTE